MSSKINESLNQDVSALLDGELDELGYARVLAAGEDPALREQIRRYSIMQSLLHSEHIEVESLSSDISMRLKNALDAEALPAVEEMIARSGQKSNSKTQNQTHGMQWLKPLTGFAMAASVAFLMVFSVDYWRTIEGPNLLAAKTAEETLAPAVATTEQQDLNAAFDVAADAHLEKEVNGFLRNNGVVTSHVSFSEQQLNDPYQVVVAADKELRKRELILLKAHEENTQLQQQLREYLIRHTQQTANNSESTMLPVARVSFDEPVTEQHTEAAE